MRDEAVGVRRFVVQALGALVGESCAKLRASIGDHEHAKQRRAETVSAGSCNCFNLFGNSISSWFGLTRKQV